MKFILLAVLKNIKNLLSWRKPPSNGNYRPLLESEKPMAPAKQDIEVQAEQIQWLLKNVGFYPYSVTTVYNEGSAYDILMACRQYNLNIQEAPRLFQGAVQWNISYLDMAEMMSNVDQAQTQPPQ